MHIYFVYTVLVLWLAKHNVKPIANILLSEKINRSNIITFLSLSMSLLKWANDVNILLPLNFLKTNAENNSHLLVRMYETDKEKQNKTKMNK